MQEQAWCQCKAAAWVPSPWALPVPSLLAQPLHMGCFLDLSEDYLLSASPPASAEPTQSKAATPVIIINGNLGCGWLSYLYSEFVTLKTSFSSPIKVSLDEHQYHCDSGPSQPVSPKLLGYLVRKKGDCSWVFPSLWFYSVNHWRQNYSWFQY